MPQIALRAIRVFLVGKAEYMRRTPQAMVKPPRMGDRREMMGELTHIHCITCGVEYGLPNTLLQHHQDYGGYHHCPNGHQQGWDKDNCGISGVRRERDRLKQRLAQKDDEIQAAHADARKTAAAYKGQITKMKKRASAGTCPCCNRTFQNVSTHMKRQHPSFVEEQGAKVVKLKTA